MADIRINELPTETTPSQGDWVAIDGATTRKATVQAVTEAGRPVASQSEAEAGVNNVKVMTPLTVKQSIAVSAATVAQGAKADSALQPTDIGVTVASQANGALAATALQPGSIGVTVQGYDADLAAIAALSTVADRVPYSTGVSTWALATFTAAGRALVDDADASAQRTTLGLGSLATLSSINNSNWSGTDLAITNGGTGASDAPTALSNLGGQPTDALLTAIAGLTTAAGGFIRTTGVDTVAAQSIVGTVSQSSGTPTGSIVERGSNGNGEYVRFADGTQMCTRLVTMPATTNVETSWAFPASFTTIDHVGVGGSSGSSRPTGGSSFADRYRALIMTAVAHDANNWLTMVNQPNSGITGTVADYSAKLFAIGRWF